MQPPAEWQAAGVETIGLALSARRHTPRQFIQPRTIRVFCVHLRTSAFRFLLFPCYAVVGFGNIAERTVRGNWTRTKASIFPPAGVSHASFGDPA